MEVSFVILTWNSSRYIENCLKSYIHSTEEDNITAEIFIVDNGSVDDTPNIIRNEIIPRLSTNHTINVIQLEKNYGTTISRNIALKRSTGKYIVVCDSDTQYYKGSLKKAFDFIKTSDDVGLIAPLLLWPDGEPQPTIRKFPTLYSKGSRFINIFFKLPIKYSDLYEGFPWSEMKPVEVAASACWLFKREMLDRVGYFDERIFYSPEDVDYCMRMNKEGLKVLFYPDILIYHHCQRITHKNPFSHHSLSHMLGLLYYFGKHKYIFNPRKIGK